MHAGDAQHPYEALMKYTAPLFALALSLAPFAANAQLPVAVGTPVYSTTAPPAVRVEVQGVAPGPGYTWVAGYWAWNGNGYTWSAGHWEQPPQPTLTWEAPQWEREGGRYRFRPGRWARREMGAQGPVVPPPVVVAQPAQPATVLVPMAPPRPRFERRTRPERPDQVWVAGAWSWNGSQYVWSPGHWETPPRAGARWNGPAWRRQGRQWVVVPGGWR